MDPPPPPFPTFRYWIANSGSSTFLTADEIIPGEGISVTPSGNGSLILSAAPPRNVFNHVSGAFVYGNSTDTQITALDTPFSTEKADQDIVVRIMLNCETDHDGVIYVKVDGTEIGSHTDAAGSRTVGLSPCVLDTDMGTSMTSNFIQLRTTVSSVGSHLLTVHRRGSTSQVYLNRTANDANNVGSERTASNVSIDYVN